MPYFRLAWGRGTERQIVLFLSEIDGVTLFGPPPDRRRTSTVSFSVDGHSSGEVARRLVETGLFLSDGDFYALTVVEKLGLAGVVRAGFACYTNEAEIDRLLDGVRQIAAAS